MVDAGEAGRCAGIRGGASAKLPPPSDERGHRPGFEQGHGREEGDLQPEQRGGDVEGAPLLEASERARDARREPEQRGNPPDRVGREEAGGTPALLRNPAGPTLRGTSREAEILSQN